MMHVNVQERGACDLDAFLEGILDVLEVVETTAVFHIDNQVRTGKCPAVTHTEVVFSILLRHAGAADGMLFFRLGGA